MLDSYAKHNTYDDFWLSSDMKNMGCIFEYCNKYCEQLFKVSIDRESFLNSFMRSNIRKEMESNHPRLLSQSAIDSVEMYIEVDCDGNINQFKQTTSKQKQYLPNQMYWVGWMYAYLHHKEDISCSQLIEIIPIEDMLEYYYFGHEIDLKAFHSHIKHRFKNQLQSV